MKLSTTTSHTLHFQVYSCWDEEGGMGERTFGKVVDTIEEAITNIQLARLSSPDENWFIRITVETTTTKK